MRANTAPIHTIAQQTDSKKIQRATIALTCPNTTRRRFLISALVDNLQFNIFYFSQKVLFKIWKDPHDTRPIQVIYAPYSIGQGSGPSGGSPAMHNINIRAADTTTHITAIIIDIICPANNIFLPPALNRSMITSFDANLHPNITASVFCERHTQSQSVGYHLVSDSDIAQWLLCRHKNRHFRGDLV